MLDPCLGLLLLCFPAGLCGMLVSAQVVGLLCLLYLDSFLVGVLVVLGELVVSVVYFLFS